MKKLSLDATLNGKPIRECELEEIERWAEYLLRRARTLKGKPSVLRELVTNA